MAKYKVTGSLAILPYYPDAGNGMPLPASRSNPENAMRDEYGRVTVGHFTLNQGQEFYAGSDNLSDDGFYTYDDAHVEKLLKYNAIEEVGNNEQVAEEGEQKPVKKSRNKDAPAPSEDNE